MSDVPRDSGGNFGEKHVAQPQDFVDGGRRWGTNETEAQVIKWVNIVQHLMGITAAMEGWPAQEPSSSSSSSCMGENVEDEEGDDINHNAERDNHTNGGTRTRQLKQKEPQNRK